MDTSVELYAEYTQEEVERSIKARLSKLQCPFTWDLMDNMIRLSVTSARYFAENEEIPHEICTLDLWMDLLLKCYRAAISTNDCSEWTENIEGAEQLLIQMQQQNEMSQMIKAIEHVFYATKCFLLHNADKMDELKEIIENISDVDKFNNIESSTLYGCQSIALFKLRTHSVHRAIDVAKKAVEFNEDCALWHFILAVSLRRLRRDVSYNSETSDMEENHFELAYAISNDNHTYAIYYLQMRLEKFWKYNKDRNYAKRKFENEIEVLRMSKQILSERPQNVKLLLKLARIFIRVSSDETIYAKECLDAIQRIEPNHTAYFHYYGLLYESCGEYKEALLHYNMAAELYNLSAEFCYIKYGWETGEVEPLPHLLRMLKKYEQLTTEQKIRIHLYIAAAYISLYNDVPNAAEYFMRALKIDPQNKIFKIYFKCFDFWTPSILQYLRNYFLRKLQRYQGNLKFQVSSTCRIIQSILDTSTLM